MRTSGKLLGAAIAAFVLLVPAGVAGAAKRSVSLDSAGQKAILAKGLEVTVRAAVPAGASARLRIEGLSSSFDQPQLRALTGTRTVVLRRSGSRSLTLPLTAAGRRAIKSCEPRRLKVTAGGATDAAELIRQTAACKPKPVDLSRASECDFIGAQQGSLCMLPFPDNFYTVKDGDSNTGRRLNFRTSAMPVNVGGVPIDAAPYNGNDGFSPGQAIVVRVPGLDNPDALAKTGAVPINDLGRYKDADSPVVVIDTKTGKRWPVWVEIDSNATTPGDTAVLIHPAKNFDASRRYIVAMRNLKTASGKTIAAPEGFRYYRDDLPSGKAPINRQRARFDSVFSTLRKAGIDRGDLYLAWDFTVASDENIGRRLLSIRKRAFAELGDTTTGDGIVQGNAPDFTVTSVENDPDPELARRVKGTFTVPCYLTSVGGVPCAPGSRFDLDSSGLPQRNGTWTANFDCIVPHAAIDDPGHAPARPSLYGHGLLGDAGETHSGPQRTLAQSHNFIFCGTDLIGFSENDVVTAIGVLQNMGLFPQITDRVQQGLLNELFLGRLLDNPGGFASVKAFHVDAAAAAADPNGQIDPTDPANASTIDTQKLYYNGNSQGGIYGGTLTAISPDFTRASLGVPAMNYSVLLNRSIDFGTYQAIFNPSYPTKLNQALVLATVQLLWDRSDPNGYAHRMTDRPLGSTPPHKVLMNVAFGDHQVTNWQADVQARTVGARAHGPVVSTDRWPGVDPLYGIPRIESYPFTGSAIVYWDGGPIGWDPNDLSLGTNPPPLTNIPNTSGKDPHSLPRNTAAEQQMVSDFLMPDAASKITDTCGGAPCYSGTYTGP